MSRFRRTALELIVDYLVGLSVAVPRMWCRWGSPIWSSAILPFGRAVASIIRGFGFRQLVFWTKSLYVILISGVACQRCRNSLANVGWTSASRTSVPAASGFVALERRSQSPSKTVRAPKPSREIRMVVVRRISAPAQQNEARQAWDFAGLSSGERIALAK